MSIDTRDRETAAYEQEIRDTLLRLRDGAPPLRALDYFFDLVETHFSVTTLRQKRAKIIVLGASAPEELIYAAGATPHWILGGSPRTGSWAAELTPRDADPVSRSMLGFLENDTFDFAKDALILLPIVNDSSRKLCYLLRQRGRKVHPIDFPPVKAQGAAVWIRQWDRCAEALSAHTGRRVTNRAVRRAAEMVAACKVQLRRFLQAADQHPGLLSGSLRMFVAQSYYCATDLMEWCLRLAALTAECRHFHAQKHMDAKGELLLLGSPVCFPNYKVPFLLEDAGLRVCAQLDSSTQKLLASPSHGTISGLPQHFYQNDCSAAYVKNDSFLAAVSRLLDEQSIDGVVYQVLKGQLEYDFELERLEALFAARNLPVFRLETDYNAQDIEQLRIRTDAFAELLTQRRYRKEARAV